MSAPTFAQLPEPPERPPVAEGRGYARHHYRAARAVRYLARAPLRADWAVVRDIAADGAGLVLGQDPGAGAVLLLQLPVGGRGETRTRLAQVVRAVFQPDGTWLVGCRFCPPLSEDELALVRR
jgi:hypothetical protein